MAAVLTPQLHDPRRGTRPGPRPALRVLEGGRGAAAVRYRRRRIVAALTLVAVVAVVWSLASSLWPAAGADGAGESVVVVEGVEAATGTEVGARPSGDGGAVVVVQPGDTLWSIAGELRPGGDLRPVVDELAARAGGGSLQVGQRIPVEGLTAF